MIDVNPYLPPDAILAVEQNTSTIELATLGQRFWAGILDAIIGIACALPLLFAFGIFNPATGEEPPFMVSLGIALIAFILFTRQFACLAFDRKLRVELCRNDQAGSLKFRHVRFGLRIR